MDHFASLLKIYSKYKPRGTWKIQFPDRIEPVPKNQKHIEILHSCSDIATNLNGHWVCSYYDTQHIYIYDSLNLQKLHDHHKTYLEKLYPFYSFDKKVIRFPKVQLQPNSYDCGVFAIAFAVSILFGLQPNKVLYDHSLMRQHLVHMFQCNKISHFPRIVRPNDPKDLLSLDEAQKKEDLDQEARKRRSKRSIKEKRPANLPKKLKTDITNISEEICKLKSHDMQEDNTREKREIYHNKKNIHTYQRKKQLVQNIKKKYTRITLINNNIKMKYTKEKYIKYISEALDIPSLSESRLEAERIAKWCFHIREQYILTMKIILSKCKEKVEICLTRAADMRAASLEHKDYVNAFCGQSKHTASSELYFAETTYHILNFSESIIMNSEGKAINILPIIQSKNKMKKAWHCSSLCKIADNVIINDMKSCFEKLLNCTLKNLHKFLYQIHKCNNEIFTNRLGHPHGCYINYKICRSPFLIIELVSPHYPMIRYIKRLLYKLINIDEKLNILDKALNDTNIKTLLHISMVAQQEAQNFTKSNVEINLNEDEIKSQYPLAFKAFTKRSMDSPRYACISCTKYCFDRDTVMIKICKRNVTTVWNNFINDVGLKLNEYCIVCKYCNRYFKDNKMPPTCRCNKLEVQLVPKEIAILNYYERILIQRAKAFQTVQRMGTVMNKNLPHRNMIPNVKGRTFHLPLPLEETLKKICPSDQPINFNHELYILVRGIPTKANVVWENLVDVTKVWNALMWLKYNNPIYSDIILPTSSEGLLYSGLRDVEFQEDNSEIDDKVPQREKKSDQNNKCNTHKQEHKALLTQMSQSDQYYEHLTIYPMYEKRINESATSLYQMLKVHDVPLDNRNKDLDVKCFPDLYPFGINGQHEDRNVRITDYEYIKARLMSQHSHFRLNIQYLFYLLHDSNMRQLNGGIFHKMNVTNPRERYTAASYLEQLDKQQLESNLSTIFARLRNTEQYWRIPRSNLHCMIRHYGPATWFLTLSPCEWLWEDLAEYLREINESFAAKKSVSELIALDPVSTSRFIDNKFKAILDFINSPDDPIGEVTHYFWRREYQSRGMQHFHLLIWINDAPIIGTSSNEEIASFILKYVTCRMPNKKLSPELYRRVHTHQRHVHNNYCLRNKKSKIGFSKVCRFGFSRPVTHTLKIRDVAVSIANRRNLKTKSRLYDLPRSQEEININDYNPAILTAWEGNMDIQYVGEKSALLTWYTTKYVSKAEKSNAADHFDKISSTKSLRSNLWNIGMRMLSHRECGALEAADTLLGISLYATDKETTIRWLDVNIIRNRRLKSRKEIELLNAESTDIFCPSLIDTHYPNRPKKLESTNLYDYAKWYDFTKTKPCSKKVEYYMINEFLYLRKRKRGYLINHYIYNVQTQPERYYFSLLLLFQPWRDINELKNGCDTYAEAFSLIQFQLKDVLQYHERIIDIQQGMDNIKELIEKEVLLEDTKDEKDNFDNCALECVPLEVEGAMKDFKDVGNKFEDHNVDEMVTQLNTDQKRIFDKIITGIESNTEILRLYVSGEGGTGKSFLIKTIRLWIKKNIKKDTAVTAPTGIAAFNIDGLTIHRLFQLPVEHGYTAKYRQLSDMALKTIRDELRNVVLIIIDEVSMISNITLMYIHLRLTEIFNTEDCDDGWFGKKHILLFGDLLQLPPVREEPSFIELSIEKIEKCIGAMGSVNLWSLFSYDELRINVRQQGDTSYREILSRIRIGTVTCSDISILNTRKIKFTKTTCDGRLEELCNYLQSLPTDAVCLLPTCALCDTLNTAMLSRISSNEIQLIAQDVADCASYLKKKVLKILNTDDEDSSRTAGLARVISVKLGARIMIRRNIDVTLGLVNGTIGTITSIIKNNNEIEKIKIMLPSGTEYIIERLSVKFQVMDRAFVVRKQFPICLSYGITIHKSQGLSLQNAVVEAGNSVFSCGQIYVALSRVTTLSGLHLINYDPSSVKANESAIIEYNKLRKQYRPDLTTIDMSNQRVKKVCDLIWAIQKNALECQNDDNNDDIRTSWCVRGLLNNDNVSCYANSAIQCIFHSLILRKTISCLQHSNNMKKLLDCYVSNKSLNITAFRTLAGNQYLANIQQDAAQFIIHLINSVDVMKNVTEHQLNVSVRCKACNYTNMKPQTNYVLQLQLPGNLKKSYTFEELMQYNFSHWNDVEQSCDNCGANSVLRKIDIMFTQSILIFQLLLFKISNGKVIKITNCNIKSIPTTNINITGNTYKIISAIFHYGENVTDGHYTNILRGKGTEWILINDLKVNKCSWPRNAKNAYMFFAERV